MHGFVAQRSRHTKKARKQDGTALSELMSFNWVILFSRWIKTKTSPNQLSIVEQLGAFYFIVDRDNRAKIQCPWSFKGLKIGKLLAFIDQKVYEYWSLLMSFWSLWQPPMKDHLFSILQLYKLYSCWKAQDQATQCQKFTSEDPSLKKKCMPCGIYVISVSAALDRCFSQLKLNATECQNGSYILKSMPIFVSVNAI